MVDDDKLIAIWLKTDRETLRQRLENDKEDVDVEECILVMEDVCQIPTDDEWFDEIEFVESTGVLSSDDQVIDLARKHCQYAGSNANEARNIFESWAMGLCNADLYGNAGKYVIEKYKQALCS